MASTAPEDRRPRHPWRAALYAVGTAALAFMIAVAALVLAVLLYERLLEVPRLTSLRKVAAAQAAFYDWTRAQEGAGRYGTREELEQAGFLTLGYFDERINLECAPATGDPGNAWWATADPTHPLQGRAYFINHSGQMYSYHVPVRRKVDRVTAAVPEGLRPEP